jgi:hypothetical protein
MSKRVNNKKGRLRRRLVAYHPTKKRGHKPTRKRAPNRPGLSLPILPPPSATDWASIFLRLFK